MSTEFRVADCGRSLSASAAALVEPGGRPSSLTMQGARWAASNGHEVPVRDADRRRSGLLRGLRPLERGVVVKWWEVEDFARDLSEAFRDLANLAKAEKYCGRLNNF